MERKPSLIRRLWRAITGIFSGKLGLVVAAALGLVIGIGGVTLHYAGFTKYFGNDPQTCNSCHAMNEQYDGYVKGSHANVATCNDCHAPHDSLVSKYINKAENGLMHSLKFTFGNYPENIQIRPHNKEVTEHACIYCHGNFVDQIAHNSVQNGETLSCIKCHDGVGHKR